MTAVHLVYTLRVPTLGTEEVANGLEWIFYIIFPNFCFGNSLSGIYNNYEYQKICRNFTMAICNQMEQTVSNPCCPSMYISYMALYI